VKDCLYYAVGPKTIFQKRRTTMKKTIPGENVPKAAHAVPTKPNVCGTGKAGIKAVKSCENKIDSVVQSLKTPGAESA
jgi:hypothetical protein